MEVNIKRDFNMFNRNGLNRHMLTNPSSGMKQLELPSKALNIPVSRGSKLLASDTKNAIQVVKNVSQISEFCTKTDRMASKGLTACTKLL